MSAMGCSLCAFGRRIPSSEQSAALGRPCARISEGARSCSRPSERDVRPVGRTQRGRGGAHREHDEGIGRQGGAPSSSPRSNAEALVRVPVWASGGVDRGRPGPPRSNAEVFGALTRSGVGRGRRGGAELGAEPRSSVPRGRTQRSSARSRAQRCESRSIAGEQSSERNLGARSPAVERRGLQLAHERGPRRSPRRGRKVFRARPGGAVFWLDVRPGGPELGATAPWSSGPRGQTSSSRRRSSLARMKRA